MAEMQPARKHDDLIYDVGMHKGEDTDYYLKKGFRVVGFEADPDLAAHCRSRFSDDIKNGRLVVVEGAIVELPPGETGGRTTKFYKNRNNSVWGTVVDELAHRNERLGTSNTIIEVPAVDFSVCLGRYGIPHYLKIDIEGMDVVCLKALMNFGERPDYVSIESEQVSFGKLVEEVNLLTQLGYTRFKAVQQHGISRQSEPNPSEEGHYVGYRFIEGSSGLFGADLPCEWKSARQILDQYRSIFLQYRLLGDHTVVGRYLLGRVLRRFLSRLLRRPMPGWHDTHAKHSSIAS